MPDDGPFVVGGAATALLALLLGLLESLAVLRPAGQVFGCDIGEDEADLSRAASLVGGVEAVLDEFTNDRLG